jgi:hypothetical protein
MELKDVLLTDEEIRNIEYTYSARDDYGEQVIAAVKASGKAQCLKLLKVLEAELTTDYDTPNHYLISKRFWAELKKQLEG